MIEYMRGDYILSLASFCIISGSSVSETALAENSVVY